MSVPILPRRGRRVLIYGVAPHIVIVPHYDGHRWRARIYAATITREGLIRWCGRIRYFYICYTVSVSYCARNKESRNLYYEMRVCTPISEGLLDRLIIVRRGTRARYLRRVHEYLDAVADLLMDKLRDLFARFIIEDAGREFFESVGDMVDMIDVVAPRITPPCGSGPAQTRYVLPLRRTYYAVRCRCPRLTAGEISRAASTLIEYMPIEQVRNYVAEIMRSLSRREVPQVSEITLADIERWLSEYAFAVGLRRNCTDISRYIPWLSEYARYVRSARFYVTALHRLFT
jgi:hypothetical protein